MCLFNEGSQSQGVTILDPTTVFHLNRNALPSDIRIHCPANLLQIKALRGRLADVSAGKTKDLFQQVFVSLLSFRSHT